MYFTYNTGDTLPANAFRISPSQLSKFFDSTSTWYREHLLGESGFLGSTSSELGNCIHAAAAMYHDTRTIDLPAITDYIASITNPEVDKQAILDQLPHMLPALTSYLQTTSFTSSEQHISTPILPNIFAAGTYDAYDERIGILTDFKTTSSRVPTSFPRPYYFQLMTYAYILRTLGKPIQQLRLVYITRYVDGGISEKTGKPLKSYPSEVHTLNHLITSNDFDLIESCLKLVAESVQTWQTHPELRHLLAQDYRLKQPPKPTLFI